jgi:hypothetical protein
MPIASVGTVAPRAAGAAAPRPRFAAALEAHTGRIPAATAASSPSPPGAAGAALATIERAQARLDEVLAAARAGRTFTSGELLALQAEAYRCAQVVDLGAKLAEQGAQSVKQALATQV